MAFIVCYTEPMHNNRMLYVTVGLIVLTLGVGVTLWYKELKGQNLIESKPVIDFSSCIYAQGNLDVTGTICTDTTGHAFTKLQTIATTTIATTTPNTLSPISLGIATTFLVNDTKIIDSGKTLTLVAIHDSRCKPGLRCIWAGEFVTDWTITRGTDTHTISLGTVRTNTITENNYTYTLLNANEKQAVITVNKAVIITGTGTVTGTVKIDPVCPVESIDHPCIIPSETYTSRSVIVYATNKTTELEHHPLEATGQYTLTLKAGTYGLQIRPAGIGAGEIKTVTVTPLGTSTIDFDIDTGIR